ncbi:type II toxin-antitoxin system RelE/ParE family toxin [Spirochaetota bacterium]
MFKVIIKKKALKGIDKMPERIKNRIYYLVDDLIETGPVQSDWPNYSKLSESLYHCHLARKWIACWQCEKNSITIEVYYAGSREDAPY